MTIGKKIVGSAIAASLALGVAAPAYASGEHWANQFRQEINQIERQASYVRGSQQLDFHIDRLRSQYNRYLRGGFTANEVGTMRQMIKNVQQTVAAQQRASNRYAYGNRNDRYAYNDRNWQGGYRR